MLIIRSSSGTAVATAETATPINGQVLAWSAVLGTYVATTPAASTITLTGDVTGTGTTSIVTSIATGSVSDSDLNPSGLYGEFQTLRMQYRNLITYLITIGIPLPTDQVGQPSF